MHILASISRRKDNQTKKCGQLVDYYDKFLEKSYPQYGGETSPRSFSGKLKLNIYLDQKPKILSSLFLLYAKLRAIEIYWN